MNGGLKLRTKLLVLLLAFGALPLALAIAVGYRVGETAVTLQAERAVRQLALGQAVHLATELSREELLLRTIAGQLPPPGQLDQISQTRLVGLLVQSLPRGGVFDGLRIVRSDGRVVARVALQNTEPNWPTSVPAADWGRERLLVHREAGRVLAYLIAVPLGEPGRGVWLEGHVRTEDFTRVFSLPDYLLEGARSGILDRSGEPVFAPQDQALADLAAAVRRYGTFAGGTSAVVRGRVMGAGSLIALAEVPGTRWVFATALPLDLALAPLSRLRNTAVIGFLGLVVSIVLTAAWAARTVTTPLTELAEAARRFGHTGAYRPLTARGGGEVALLVEAFNRMADDLSKSRDEIEQLHARELERAQQLATVGELASGVAHEIRNPLTGVLGALDLALKKLPSEDAARPLLEEAQRQLRRIEATTQQLLRYARPPELREVLVDANRLVERAAHLVAPQARAAQVRLRTEPCPAAVPVRADPELMVQVLVNLMLNGIEAMPDGGELTVWVARRAPEVWIGVRDTGPGIPPERRAEVFRPFFTTKHTGTGLGLPISQQIVVRHRGSLRIEDAPGGGATFIVALPLADQTRVAT
ncbi:MAG: hypothetical protein KatS3mg081_2947 [Gemmatimonadales bacterium]|nr:MAG: hypothetical protein KatS3mg081_2947 [Gemmatimonadales bacterium]